MNRIVKGLTITLVAMFAATSAFAVTKSANIAVSANIAPACTISAAPLAFGTYDPLGVNKTTPLAMSTTVTVQCVAELPATITLDEGLYKDTGSAPATPARRMQCNDYDQEFMNYSLWQDSGHTQAWGAGAAALTILIDGSSHDYPVFGLIPAGQVLEDGGYVDTIVASVIY